MGRMQGLASKSNFKDCRSSCIKRLACGEWDMSLREYLMDYDKFRLIGRMEEDRHCRGSVKI